MRPHWLRALAVLSVLAPAFAAAQTAPVPEAATRPGLFIVVPPLTSFPDPIALSLAANLRYNVTVEAGASLIAPGAFARAGLLLPVAQSPLGGTDLLAYGGYRAIALPTMKAVQGPTIGAGIRRWKRDGWGWELSTGFWITDATVECVGDCDGPNEIVLPEIRLAAIHAR
jgi:hypothetical protein